MFGIDGDDEVRLSELARCGPFHQDLPLKIPTFLRRPSTQNPGKIEVLKQELENGRVEGYLY